MAQPGEFAPPYRPPPEAVRESAREFIERTRTLPPGAPGVEHRLSFAQEEGLRRAGTPSMSAFEAAKGPATREYLEAHREAMRFGLPAESILDLLSGPQDGLSSEKTLEALLQQSRQFTAGYETPEARTVAIRTALEREDFRSPEGRLKTIQKIRLYVPGERLRLEEEARKKAGG